MNKRVLVRRMGAVSSPLFKLVNQGKPTDGVMLAILHVNVLYPVCITRPNVP